MCSLGHKHKGEDQQIIYICWFHFSTMSVWVYVWVWGWGGWVYRTYVLKYAWKNNFEIKQIIKLT
jgi:hypothetical protein